MCVCADIRVRSLMSTTDRVFSSYINTKTASK